jgi:hypothetical protein
MSQIALPLAWPAAEDERDFIVTGANQACGPTFRALVALAGDGDDPDRPAQVGSQPARPDLRGEIGGVLIDDAERPTRRRSSTPGTLPSRAGARC